MENPITISYGPEDILHLVNENRGILWDKIDEFRRQLESMDGAIVHHTEEMEDMFPVKHHIENGLYTREILMPKGSVVVSFIHKQSHPSFFLSGEMSILTDDGDIKRIKAPMTVHTDVGTQRVAYMHEDCVWTCVYRTDKLTVEEAERDVYTLDYTELPAYVILNKKLLCQE